MSNQYRIEQVSVKNFKCFGNDKFYDFNIDIKSGLTILSGPNGFGKTTFFDVVELFFRKDITRLAKDIEGRFKNKSNIFLKNKNYNAYLLLTMKDINKTPVTYLLVIPKDPVNLSNNLSNIKIFKCSSDFNRNEIDKYFQNDYCNILDEIESFEKEIGYEQEYFNVYYYISQAESVHFLKNKMAERESTMNKLLGIERITDLLQTIEVKINGLRSDSKTWIRDQLEVVDRKKNQLAEKILQFKQGQIDKQEYVAMFSDKMIDRIDWLKWDFENFEFKNYQKESIFKQIDRAFLASFHNDDYKKYIFNQNIEKQIANTSKSIENFIECANFIKEGKLFKIEIEEEIKEISEIIEINEYSEFIYSYLEHKDESKFNIENLKNLSEIISIKGYQSIDIQYISDLIVTIQKSKDVLDEYNKKLLNLKTIRKNLVDKLEEFSAVHIVQKNECPLCKRNFETELALKQNIDSLSKEIEDLSSGTSQNILEKQNEIVSIFNLISGNINKFIIDKEKIDVKKQRSKKLNEIIKNETEIQRINFLAHILKDDDVKSNVNEIKVQLENKKIIYNTSDFENIFATEELDQIYKMFYEIEKEENLFNEFIEIKNKKSIIEIKKKYINCQYALNDNKIYEKNFLELKETIKQGLILTKFQKSLDKIESIFKKLTNEHKQSLSENLKIPLLIFTGKLLQDYQNGLGVFIHESEMRFVPSGAPYDDILNTFSSGQLSAFVLAFLLVMNSVYSKNKNNIDFLLIDDPVQTMDDINIASFIELLRNNYKDRQIILSTHENDKERYMLYKFIKFGIKVDSLNVKESLYTIN